jgi:hypothetical protein
LAAACCLEQTCAFLGWQLGEQRAIVRNLLQHSAAALSRTANVSFIVANLARTLTSIPALFAAKPANGFLKLIARRRRLA